MLNKRILCLLFATEFVHASVIPRMETLESRVTPAQKPPKAPTQPAQPAQPVPSVRKAPISPQLAVPYFDDARELSRSTRLPKLRDGALELTALGYPSGELYISPRQNNPKEVYDFKDNKLRTTAVSQSITLKKPSNNYATEHIIEPRRFFRNKFVKPVPGPLTIANRPNPPSYALGTDPQRDSLMRLFFDAMGSIINPRDLVLCEAAINSYKMRVWSLKEPMSASVYDLALADAMAGAVPSADFLSALRLTFGAYGYLNSPGVVTHMRNINKNIRLELANAGALYNEPKVTLVTIWDAFMKVHFEAMDVAAKKWARARLFKTKSEIAVAIKKYTALADTLKKAETGPDANKHATDQKKKQNTLKTALTKQNADVTAAQKKVVDAKKLRATKRKPAGADKRVRDARKALLKAEKEVGKTQRKIHELYSHLVNLLVKN
ncbi:Killer toxin subunits alpha/beta 4 [Stagonosporopsis vannaccii]|nr:Killer toxin subunits alpha/beta 4 [Stagonosporopsis vannaccii]